MLTSAIVLITAALVFYSLGVWTEHRSGRLSWWHAASFAAGLTFDMAGTSIMKRISDAGGMTTSGAAGMFNQIMAVTGALALLVMAVHLAWAVVVLVRNREKELAAFHTFSVGVWVLWLVPYVTGMVGSMAS